MKSTDVTGWTDMSPDSRFRNRVPSTIITADEIANGEWDGLLGDVFNGGVEREVVYYDGTTKWWMVLTLYVHPAGAEIGSTTTRQPVWSTSLAEGDAIWLIRRGRVEMRNGANVAAGDRIVTDISTTGTKHGCVRTAVTTVATQAQIQEYTPGYAGKCIGIAQVTVTEAASIAAGTRPLCKLDLPPRMYR